MKINIEYGNSVFSLPKESLKAALLSASGFQLQVLLLVASDDALRLDYDKCRESLCTLLDCTPSAFDKAIQYWQTAGVIGDAKANDAPIGEIEANAVLLGERKADEAVPPIPNGSPSGSPLPDAPPADKTESTPEEKRQKPLLGQTLPGYTEEAMAKTIESNPELPGLIDMCQQLIGKMFSPADTMILVGLYDYLGLESEYIATLFAYCREKGKKSLRYIEKTALNLYDEGVDNTEALKAYIKYKECREQNLSQIRTLIGAGSRQFTTKEQKMLSCWFDEWRFDFDVIVRAYEVTVDRIKEPSLPYMNRVLENWHKEKLHTVEAVEASLEAYKKNKAEAANQNSGFETDEFFEAALRRSDKYYQG